MVLSLSDDQTRLLRCYAQRLHPRQSDAAGSVAQVVRDVEHAREQERSVVRAWCTGLTPDEVSSVTARIDLRL